MQKVGLKSIVTLIVVFTFYTCIDPYSPTLRGYESLLVVDGLITNENSSYSIKLSRTMQDQSAVPERISDATVFITDETGNQVFLISHGRGVYKTDSLLFRGNVGSIYTLHIITPDGSEYESEQCIMEPVPEIDSIYFSKSQNLINNGMEMEEGILVSLDSKRGDDNSYYRWAYDETWKFRVPTPKKYDYIDEETFVIVNQVNEFCWKRKLSDGVIIENISSWLNESLIGVPITFIASDKSDRLMMQYNIQIRQYSISKKEYDFWNNLKSINESGGDIFATQPYPVISNIHNINKGDEKVLGYFQVSAVSEKQMDILFSDILAFELPFYHPECIRLELAPEDIPMPKFAPPLTWEGLYSLYCIKSDYYFVEPVISGETNLLEKMVFARPECADCLLTGTSAKPDFWIDKY